MCLFAPGLVFQIKRQSSARGRESKSLNIRRAADTNNNYASCRCLFSGSPFRERKRGNTRNQANSVCAVCVSFSPLVDMSTSFFSRSFLNFSLPPYTALNIFLLLLPPPPSARPHSLLLSPINGVALGECRGHSAARHYCSGACSLLNS